MPDFLVSGVDGSGKRITERVSAETAQAAHQAMSRRGFADVQLHTEDAGAAMGDMDCLDDGCVTAEEMVQMQELTRVGMFGFTLGKLLRQSWWVILLLSSVALWDYWEDSRLQWSQAGLFVPVLLIQVLLAAWVAFFGSAVEYDRMLEAGCWGRWEEVLARTPGLRGKVPELDLDAREAAALIGLGRVEEGLSKIAAHVSSDDGPKWMYYIRRAELLDQLKRHDEAIADFERSLEEAPDNPTVTVDLAFAYLKQGVHTAEARRLIERAKAMELGGLLSPIMPSIEGLLAVREERYADAIALFDAGQRGVAKYAQHPMVRLIIDEIKAMQAVAYAGVGDKAHAVALMEQVRPRLVAIDAHRLLRMADEAIAAA